jgi:hypothetical protein
MQFFPERLKVIDISCFLWQHKGSIISPTKAANQCRSASNMVWFNHSLLQ